MLRGVVGSSPPTLLILVKFGAPLLSVFPSDLTGFGQLTPGYLNPRFECFANSLSCWGDVCSTAVRDISQWFTWSVTPGGLRCALWQPPG